MEFKIPVDEMQLITNKLTSVAKVGSDDMDGLVLIETIGEEVRFNVNDKGVSLSITSQESEIVTPGKVLCKLSDFKGYISRFTVLIDDFGTDFFTFLVKDEALLIKTKTIFRGTRPSYKKLKVALLDPSIYPKIKIVEEAQLIVNSDILKEGIDSVLHCVNPKEIRASLKGVAISVQEDKLIFAGTNGVKLSETIIDVHTESIEESTHIFKFGFAGTLRYILDNDSQVFITFDGSNVYVRSNNLYIVGSTIVNESFPNYKKAFDLFEHTIVLPRFSFSDSVSNAVDILDVEDNSRLSINIDGNKIVLTNERIEIEQEFDEPFEHSLQMDVNGHFLNDMLLNFVGDTINLRFKDENNPLIFGSGVDDKHTVLLTNLRRR